MCANKTTKTRGLATGADGSSGKVGPDEIVEYVRPPRVLLQAAQVWYDAAVLDGNDASNSAHFGGYASGTCAGGAGDPNCPCGAWTDVRDGVWSSESYWCSNISGGGWSEMDRGDGYYEVSLRQLDRH